MSMMERDMVHSLVPALDPVVRRKDLFAEAALVQSWRIHVAEMCQTVEDPFPVVGSRKILETGGKILCGTVPGMVTARKQQRGAITPRGGPMRIMWAIAHRGGQGRPLGKLLR
ncbi:MAG: hypothetical protein Q9188_006006 [Gyalolechia gomerana]